MSVRRLADGFRTLHESVNSPHPAVGFGLRRLDKMLNGGLRPSQVAMGMAFSHVGKTALAINQIASNPKVPALFFSVEMPIDTVAAKLTATVKSIPTTTIEEDFKGEGFPPYAQEMADRFPYLFIDDSPDLTMKAADVAFEQATEMLAEQGQCPPRLCVFDYLELVQSGGMMEKATQVDKAAEKVHVFARKHRTSVLLLHQVGKGDAGGGADLLDLGSGRYGGFQNMDVVIGMSSPGAKKDLPPNERQRLAGKRTLQVLKNRITGQLDMAGTAYMMDPVSMRLTEWGTQPILPSWSPPERTASFEELTLMGAAA